MRTVPADNTVEDGGSAVILATLTAPDGRVIRAATQPILITADLGGPWLYDHLLSGLDTFTDELDLYALDATASLQQAEVEIVTTDDLATLQGQWHQLLATEVEIAVTWPGEAWERRRVLMRGPMQALELGRLGEASRFTAEAAPAVTSAKLGDDDRDIGDDYGTGLLDIDGEAMTDPAGPYPIILGTPYRVAGIKVGDIGGGYNGVVLAGHTFVDLTAVTMYNDGVALPTAQALLNGTVASGDLGYTRSTTRFYSPSGPHTYTGAVTVDYPNGGIACFDSLTRATKSAADVVRWLLGKCGLPIDWGRQQRCLDKLASWPMGIAVTQQSDYLSVLRDIAKVLPIIEVPGASGLWFAYADPEDMPIEGTLRVGAEIVGGSGRLVLSDRDALRNAFTMRFFRDSFTGNYLQSVTVDEDTSAVCALSAQLFGELADDPIDCEILWDATTARRALVARAARLALPRRSRDYLLAPDAYTVEAGSCFRVVDPDYGIDARGYVRASSAVAPLAITIDYVDHTPASAL